MPRYRLTIEYDGTPYVGWQAQDNGPSVQSAIETAIERMTGERPLVYGSGRTDTGVHALAQVAHADISKSFTPEKLRDGLNAWLRDELIVIRAAAVMPDDWHARFSATRRHYLYRIVNRPAPAALERSRAWHVRWPLDADAMHAAAQRLVGHHDFTTFRATNCQAKSPMKTLETLVVTRAGEEVEIRTSSRSFLHNQVRSMAGSLKLVGEGKWTADDLEAALQARHRTACGPVAPAHGLYLTQVDY